MSSSTSSSRQSPAHFLVVFLLTFAALAVPYELLARHGGKTGALVRRQSRVGKIETFRAALLGGTPYANVIVGNSRAEKGLRPDLLDQPLGGPVYNLSMDGISAIHGLELLLSFEARPERVLVAVSPLDFTLRQLEHGEKALATTRAARPAGMTRRDLPTLARDWTYTVFHGATPERRRNLADWLELAAHRGDVREFMVDRAATGGGNLWIRGFVGMRTLVAEETFETGPPDPGPDYAQNHARLLERLEASVRTLERQGTDVVLVRVPTPLAARRLEDATTFDSDIRALAQRTQTPYVDGMTLIDQSFPSQRRHFADPSHLNHDGATRFTRQLAKALTPQ